MPSPHPRLAHMPPAERALLALLEQAERTRDAARAHAARADEAMRQARMRASQLHDYREDYRRRGPALNGNAATIEMMRCHQGFVQRLDQAVEQQGAQLLHLEHQAQAAHEAVLALEMRVAAVNKLIERRAAEARHLQGRADQRQTDEAAARLAKARGAFETH